MAQVFESIGIISSAASRGTLVTSGADGEWGSYIELSSSTSDAWDGFFLNAGRTPSFREILVEVATGAASSEVSIYKARLIGGSNVEMSQGMTYYPIPVPSGSRVSVRTNSDAASVVVHVSILGIGTSQTKFLKEGDNQESLGFDDTSLTEKGTTVDPGGTANTKGSWVEFDASTANDVDYITIDTINSDIAISGDPGWLVDIGTGVADSEVVVVANIPLISSSAQDDLHPGTVGPFRVAIPSGTRIAIRCQSSSIGATDRLVVIVAHTLQFAGAAGETLTALSGSFALTGQAATTLVGHLLDAAFGSFTLTGAAATTSKGFLLTAVFGSFTLTGAAATTTQTYILPAVSGAFTLTGADATTKQGSLMIAVFGSFALTGADATTTKTKILVAAFGSFTLTGAVATTSQTYILIATFGSFTLTGAAATTATGFILVGGAGSFTLTGAAATTLVGHLLTAVFGSFTLTGADATTSKAGDATTVADSGTFTLTGANATTTVGHLLTAAFGSFTLTGAAATTLVDRRIVAAFGSFALTGADATTNRNIPLIAAAGSFALTGQDATLTVGHLLTAVSGAFTLTGAAATTAHEKRLLAGAGSFILTGKAATTIDSGAAPVTFRAHEGLLISVGKLMN